MVTLPVSLFFQNQQSTAAPSQCVNFEHLWKFKFNIYRLVVLIRIMHHKVWPETGHIRQIRKLKECILFVNHCSSLEQIAFVGYSCKSISQLYSATQRNEWNCWPRRSLSSATLVFIFTQRWTSSIETGCFMTSDRVSAAILSVQVIWNLMNACNLAHGWIERYQRCAVWQWQWCIMREPCVILGSVPTITFVKLCSTKC